MAVIFEPWKPLGNDPRFVGRRLLIVGESHYDEGQTYTQEQIRTFTTDIVRTWGAEAKGHQRFFANIFRTLNEPNADHTSEAFRSFWHRVFFYNYVQSFVRGGARVRPTAKMFADSADAFHAVLNDVKPEAVLVMGQATWDHMSERNAVLVDHDEDGLGINLAISIRRRDVSCSAHAPPFVEWICAGLLARARLEISRKTYAQMTCRT
jgi:hypothetical protein